MSVNRLYKYTIKVNNVVLSSGMHVFVKLYVDERIVSALLSFLLAFMSFLSTLLFTLALRNRLQNLRHQKCGETETDEQSKESMLSL